MAFHLVDSQSIRGSCRIGIADKGFKKSALNKNIKALSDRTWEAINHEVLAYATQSKIEKGRVTRIDCRIVEGNPTDLTLTETMLERKKEIYGRYPLKAALDGGFASKDNLKADKGPKFFRNHWPAPFGRSSGRPILAIYGWTLRRKDARCN